MDINGQKMWERKGADSYEGIQIPGAQACAKTCNCTKTMKLPMNIMWKMECMWGISRRWVWDDAGDNL